MADALSPLIPNTAQSPSPQPRAPGLANLALLLSYDGSGFQGWQMQPHAPTVQGSLEAALRTITHHSVTVLGSGRTDSGVHALNQVANAWLPATLDLHKLRGSLNGLCAPGIACKALAWVPEDFHARHSALGKTYRYHVFNRPYPPVLGRPYCWWLRQPLDVPAMQQAARFLPGEHDFSAFRAKTCEAASPVRTLRAVRLEPGDWPDATLRLEFEASGFLQHMARILAGTLVAVGLGKLRPEAVPRILASRRRDMAAPTAPAQGLHLVRVLYDEARFPQVAELLRQG